MKKRTTRRRTNPTLQAAEREHILRALREAKGQIGGPDGAAARLGLKRTTLNSKLKKLGIERGDYIHVSVTTFRHFVTSSLRLRHLRPVERPIIPITSFTFNLRIGTA